MLIKSICSVFAHKLLAARGFSDPTVKKHWVSARVDDLRMRAGVRVVI